MPSKKSPAKGHKQKKRKPAPAPPAKVAKVSPPLGRPLQRGGRYNGTPYRESQAAYAKAYGHSLPTIKRWWKQSRPLDDADAMGEFLSPRGRKPGEKVTMGVGHPWAGEKGVVVGTERTILGEQPRVRLDNGQEVFAMTPDDFESPSIVPPKNEAPSENPVSLDESFFSGQGFLAAIERLKKAERERAAAYFKAIHQNLGPQWIQNRFREWIGVIEPLRKLAKDEPEIRKANDLTVDKSEMDAAVGIIFAGFRAAARNLPQRAAAKVVGMKVHEDIVEVLEKEIEVLLRALTQLTLEEAAQAKAADPNRDAV